MYCIIYMSETAVVDPIVAMSTVRMLCSVVKSEGVRK